MAAIFRSSKVIFLGMAPTTTLVGQSGFHNNVPIACSIYRQNQAIHWAPDLSSSNLSYKQREEWTGSEGGAHGLQESEPWKTVHVRFELQKKCSFGENFLILGDDPMIGSWNPDRALPLNWSHGHIWTLDLDMPVDLPIQYKLILQQNDQELLWQPGPDRVLRTWDTNNTIVIAEDWEKAESQKLSEEQSSNQRLVSDMATDHNRRHDDNPISGPEEESLVNAKIEPFVVEYQKDESTTNS